MNLLNQPENIRGHDEQIANRDRRRIPVGMGRAAWNEHARTRARFKFIFTRSDAQGALKHVPGFVVAVMDVRWSDETRRIRGSAGIPPFSQHKSVVDRPDDPSGERRCDDS